MEHLKYKASGSQNCPTTLPSLDKFDIWGEWCSKLSCVPVPGHAIVVEIEEEKTKNNFH